VNRKLFLYALDMDDETMKQIIEEIMREAGLDG